jgi:hypothetical protein
MSIEKTAKQEISSLAAVLIRCKSTLHLQSSLHPQHLVVGFELFGYGQ